MYHPPDKSKGPTMSRHDSEQVDLSEMSKLINIAKWYSDPTSAGNVQEILGAVMYTLKETVAHYIKDETTWHIFIQDFAAALNRRGLLSNENEQLFREHAYQFMHE
jgi:hypothetical protein